MQKDGKSPEGDSRAGRMGVRPQVEQPGFWGVGGETTPEPGSRTWPPPPTFP